LGPIPNPQSPIPKKILIRKNILLKTKILLKFNNKLN